MVGKHTSTAIDLLRIIAIVMVVILHARTGLQFQNNVFESMADVMSRGVGALGVPLFLVVSGFLAGVKPKFATLNLAMFSAISRSFGLMFAYVFWNTLIAVIVFFAISSGLSVGEFSSLRLSEGFFGIYGLNSPFPIAYQFWFVRELIVVSFFIAVLSHFAIDLWRLLVLFFIIIILGQLFFDARSQMVFISYSIGYSLARLNINFNINIDAYLISNSRIYRLATLLPSMLLLYLTHTYGDWDGPCLYIFLITGSVFTIVMALLLAQKEPLNNLFKFLAGSTFFIFAAHEPLLAFVKKIIDSRFGAEIAYVLAPVLVVLGLLLLYGLIPSKIRSKYWFVFIGSVPNKSIQAAH